MLHYACWAYRPALRLTERGSECRRDPFTSVVVEDSDVRIVMDKVLSEVASGHPEQKRVIRWYFVLYFVRSLLRSSPARSSVRLSSRLRRYGYSLLLAAETRITPRKGAEFSKEKDVTKRGEKLIINLILVRQALTAHYNIWI